MCNDLSEVTQLTKQGFEPRLSESGILSLSCQTGQEMLERDWCPRVNPQLGISGPGYRIPGTTFPAYWVYLGVCRYTLMRLRLPARYLLPGSSFFETPLHFHPPLPIIDLHINTTYRPGTADPRHPGLMAHGGGCLRGPTRKSKDRTISSLNRTPLPKPHAPSPKSFAVPLTQQSRGLLPSSLTPGPAHAISLPETPLASWQ